MYPDRYERAKPNPVSLTAAVAINGALVAALLFSAPDLLPEIEHKFEGYSVAEPPPPPPKPETKPEPKARLPREVRIETPIPEIKPLPSDPIVTTTIDPQPPIPFDPGPAVPGGGTVTVDPPKPAPVLTEAKPDPRAEFQPEYPPSGRREGIAGVETVRVLVGADGRVKAVEQIRSIGDAFFAATRRQALSRWRFKPATRDGIPYESWRTMTVRFVLEE